MMNDVPESHPRPRKRKRDLKTTDGDAPQNCKALMVPEVGDDICAAWAEAEVFGTSDARLVRLLAEELWTCVSKIMAQEAVPKGMEAAFLVVKAIAPRNEMEAMLAVQQVCAHFVAIDCLSRAMEPGETVGRDYNLKYGERFMRLFQQQFEIVKDRQFLNL